MTDWVELRIPPRAISIPTCAVCGHLNSELHESCPNCKADFETMWSPIQFSIMRITLEDNLAVLNEKQAKIQERILKLNDVKFVKNRATRIVLTAINMIIKDERKPKEQCDPLYYSHDGNEDCLILKFRAEHSLYSRPLFVLKIKKLNFE